MPSPGAPLSPNLRVSAGLKLSEEPVGMTKQMFLTDHSVAIYLSAFADPFVHPRTPGLLPRDGCCERCGCEGLCQQRRTLLAALPGRFPEAQLPDHLVIFFLFLKDPILLCTVAAPGHRLGTRAQGLVPRLRLLLFFFWEQPRSWCEGASVWFDLQVPEGQRR